MAVFPNRQGKMESMRIPMPFASAEEYRVRAREVRQLAMTIANPGEQDLLFDVAEKYERLAKAAEQGIK